MAESFGLMRLQTIALVMAYVISSFTSGCKNPNAPAVDKNLQFQQDSDAIRLEHLIYWTGLIEEYKEISGVYPLQSMLSDTYLSKKGEPALAGLVRIATNEQKLFFTPESSSYRPEMDNNPDGQFQEFSMKSLVDELEKGLERAIDEKYDIQVELFETATTYKYFITKDGYLMWVPCLSCGVTPSSTLLFDGKTPTVNIASEGMVDKVTKAKTRKEMIEDSHFKRWRDFRMHDEKTMRELEKRNFKETKNKKAVN